MTASLNQWNREAKLLKAEIAALVGKAHRRNLEQNKSASEQKRDLGRLRAELDRSIAMIMSLSVKRSFLSEKGKVLILWSKKFAEKIEAYYTAHLELLNKVMWLRFIEARLTLTDILKGKGKSRAITTELSRLMSAEDDLDNKLESFTILRARLDLRYMGLVVAAANLHAMDSFGRSDAPKLLTQFQRQNPLGFASPVAAKRSAYESRRLASLALPAMAASNVAQSPLPSTTKAIGRDAILKSFDFLNLDAELSGQR